MKSSPVKNNSLLETLCLYVRFNAFLSANMSTLLQKAYILTTGSSILSFLKEIKKLKIFGLGMAVFLVLVVCFLASKITTVLSETLLCLEAGLFSREWILVWYFSSPPFLLSAVSGCFFNVLSISISQIMRDLGKIQKLFCEPLAPIPSLQHGIFRLWVHTEGGDQNIYMLISEPRAIFLTIAKEHSPTDCALELL